MNFLNKMICVLYGCIVACACYFVIFVPGGILLWALLFWFAVPVIFAILPNIYASKYILKRMLPTLHRVSRVACLGTLKPIGIDFVYAILFWLGADLVATPTSNVAAVRLWGIVQTMSIVLIEMMVGMIIFTWIRAKAEYHLMSVDFERQDRTLVKKTLFHVALVHMIVLTVMCVAWQAMIAYNVPDYFWQYILHFF